MSQSATNASAAPECVLRLHAVARAFSGIQALAGVSFDLQRGEVHALVGENGAGKSTLIKIIAGAYVPDTGSIEVDGAQHAALEPEQARQLGIGVVYQEFNLLPGALGGREHLSRAPSQPVASACSTTPSAAAARWRCWSDSGRTSIRIGSSSI